MDADALLRERGAQRDRCNHRSARAIGVLAGVYGTGLEAPTLLRVQFVFDVTHTLQPPVDMPARRYA